MKGFILKKIPSLNLLLLSAIILSCEEEREYEETVATTPPIIVEPEVFPELGHDGPYQVGSIYYGRERYIEYHPGDIPIILSAPHGGRLVPDEIPNRTYGTTVTDDNTYELTKVIMDTMKVRFQGTPHVILCRLKRTKIDANRDSIEAAQGNRYALRAWQEYHHYINVAKNKIETNGHSGLFFDMHGHGANPDGFYDLRTWLGYLVPGDILDQDDNILNTQENANKTSIRALIDTSRFDFIQVLRGKNSFGALLDSLSYKSVPSINDPGPNGSRYFSGGYNTARHGSRGGGMISAIQIEAPKPGIRQNVSTWSQFAQSFTIAVDEYFYRHIERRISN